ncbi:amidase [Castellaniella sp.]|uniref:amidase n=1 Tax=Castellaniella sp. TaxID=1955812 RepID=UPI003C7436B8
MLPRTQSASQRTADAGRGIPEKDLATASAAARILSETLVESAIDLRISDFDTDFASTLQLLAAPPLSGGGGAAPSGAAPARSSVQAVQAALDAIASSPLGSLAWRHVDAQSALRIAHAQDDAATRAAHGALQGVVTGIKDMFDRTEHAAQWGSILRREAPRARADATVIARLRASGAIPLGMLHMAEFALSPTGLNDHLGPGRNPHDTDRVSGGSSSGCGMAVGAGHVPLAIGSDTGGSIRLPAAFCGVFGLKPTQYRISRAGAMPLAPSLDCIGPLARSVELCAAAFTAMAGPDPLDPQCLAWPAPTGQWQTLSARSLTVAVPQLPEDAPVSADMRRALRHTADQLKDRGVTCIATDLPDMALLGTLCSILMGTESAALHRATLHQHPESYGGQVRRRISQGLFLGAADYYDALRLRARLLRRFVSETLSGADACLLPAAPGIAPLVSDTIAPTQDLIVSQVAYWTRGANYLGVPVLAAPAGTDALRMPLGVQLLGQPLGEEYLFALGRLLET